MGRPIEGTVLRQGPHVELLALAPPLYEPLYEALTAPEVADTWRPRGQYIPVAGWERFLVEGMAFAAVVRSRDNGTLVGFVELRDVEPIDGYGYVSAAAAPEYIGSGLMVEAVMIFVDEAISRSQLHKIYVLLSEASRTMLAGTLDELLDVEGVLHGHVMILGRRQDVTIASVSRTRFAELAAGVPLMRRLAPTDGWRLAPIPDPSPVSLDVLGALQRATGRDADELRLGVPLATLGLDSLAALEIVAALEEALGHPVPEDLMDSVETVGDLLGWADSAA